MKNTKLIAVAAVALMLASSVAPTANAIDYNPTVYGGEWDGGSTPSTGSGPTGSVTPPWEDGIIDVQDVIPGSNIRVPASGVHITPAAVQKMARNGGRYSFTLPSGAKIRLNGNDLKGKKGALEINVKIHPDPDNKQVKVEVLGEFENVAVEIYVPKMALKKAGVDCTTASVSDESGTDLGSCAAKVPNRGVNFGVTNPGNYFVK